MTIKGYIPGDYLMSCDRCGLTFRRSQIRRDGNVKGLMVCGSCWDFKATYPSPPPDRIAVPVPRPDNTTVSANNITWNYTSIGDNLFPDPWCSEVNDGLWTGGALSQHHVQYELSSRKIPTTTVSIAVTGLTIGTQYRFKCGIWNTSKNIHVKFNSESIDIFKNSPKQKWYTDTYYFISDSTSLDISWTSEDTAYIDGIYIQEYINEDRFLTNGEILDNKKPQSDFYEDNTIIPDPTSILGYGTINIFPDPYVDEAPTMFQGWPFSTMFVERSTNQVQSGTHSLRTRYVGGGIFLYGGARHTIEIDAEPNTTYRFKFYAYVQREFDAVCALFGNDNIYTNPILASPSEDTWLDIDYYEFTTPDTITDNNIYFGVSLLSGTFSAHTSYYDTFVVNEYINQTTPF